MKMTANHSALSRVVLILVAFNGRFLFGNGRCTPVAPRAWHDFVPGVTDTGFFNPHFIRDSGLIQVFLGAVLGLGMNRPAHCLELWAAAPSWLIPQAVFHLWEVAVGICAPAVIPRDFPAVNLPALMGVALTVWAWRTGGQPDGPDACPPLDVALRPKTFIASPFTGGISAFAVILPKPLGKHSPS